ncbi:MAG: N-acetyltransferase family protein [Spirochaeta sp.]
MSEFEIEIRLAEIDDLAPVFHLGERLFTSQQYSNLYRTWDEYEVTSQFNLEPDNFLVAEIDGKVIGFAIGSVIEKSRSAWTYGHLVWLGIDPSVSRRRIASRLFDRFMEIMQKQGVRMLLVDTQADNNAALAFFRGKGFGNPVKHVYLTLNLNTAKPGKGGAPW